MKRFFTFMILASLCAACTEEMDYTAPYETNQENIKLSEGAAWTNMTTATVVYANGNAQILQQYSRAAAITFRKWDGSRFLILDGWYPEFPSKSGTAEFSYNYLHVIPPTNTSGIKGDKLFVREITSNKMVLYKLQTIADNSITEIRYTLTR